MNGIEHQLVCSAVWQDEMCSTEQDTCTDAPEKKLAPPIFSPLKL